MEGTEIGKGRGRELGKECELDMCGKSEPTGGTQGMKGGEEASWEMQREMRDVGGKLGKPEGI